ncbi:MAG: LD-carboxypeptidase, partial [Devosia sp.]
GYRTTLASIWAGGSAMTDASGIVFPKALRPSDKIRLVSPASPPDRIEVEAAADILKGWGFAVDFGQHAFEKLHYLAGTDQQRLADFNPALADPDVRAIFATRGGKGSYRIADGLDFSAARADPKFVVGYSDITILQLALWKHGVGGAVHCALQGDERDWQTAAGIAPLKTILTGTTKSILNARDDEATGELTTRGIAHGPLVGGNLDMIATAAGWALPKLNCCILLLEAVNMFIGQVDRQLSMLAKGGHLDGLAGVAVGQFTDFKPSNALTINDLLRDHLGLDVPLLGGLPLGHGPGARCILMGRGDKRAARKASVGAFPWARGGDFSLRRVERFRPWHIYRQHRLPMVRFMSRQDRVTIGLGYASGGGRLAVGVLGADAAPIRTQLRAALWKPQPWLRPKAQPVDCGGRCVCDQLPESSSCAGKQ